MSRLTAGYRLYQKGNCSLIFEDDDEYRDSSSEWITDYLVSFVDGVARCNLCEDYEFRFQRLKETVRMEASFLNIVLQHFFILQN